MNEAQYKNIADAIIEAFLAPPTYEEAHPEGHPDEYQVHRWDLEKNIKTISDQDNLLGETLRALLQEIDIVDQIHKNPDEQLKHSDTKSEDTFLRPSAAIQTIEHHLEQDWNRLERTMVNPLNGRLLPSDQPQSGDFWQSLR